MKNAIIYLTRRCPRNCQYCGIHSNKVPELSSAKWGEAFNILDQLGVDFSLILGNEPWLLGSDLIEITKSITTPYAMYTTCYEPLFNSYRRPFFDAGLSNLSCGLDYPIGTPVTDDITKKSRDGWEGLKWVRKYYPEVETHATITVTNKNYKHLVLINRQLEDIGTPSNINFIHWNKDGGYDFFSPLDKMGELLPGPENYQELHSIIDFLLDNGGNIQNYDMLKLSIGSLTKMGWHCKGDPYGGPTIDSDGSLRLCGYRKGKRTSKLTIFDLADDEKVWKESVAHDAKECPGCSWSCPWMFHYWNQVDPSLGKKVFASHSNQK
jgi:MoaA/NifB/PqqE/SkfB family radical SAM enzyme